MDSSREEKTTLDLERRETQSLREKMRKLAECEEIVSAEAIGARKSHGEVLKDVEMAENNVPSSDEFDEELEEEYRNLNDIFDLPHDTYSLIKIKTELPLCIKYGIRSGVTHLNILQFSPLSRGYQVIMNVRRISILKTLFQEYFSLLISFMFNIVIPNLCFICGFLLY